MRALVGRDGRLSPEDVPTPAPSPGQALVAPRFVGICGSDVHALERQERDGGPPFVPGHEISGEVVAYHGGRPPDGAPPIGALVACVPYVTAGGGPRLIGFTEDAPGALAELVLVDASSLVPVPAGVPADRAALAEPLAVGIHAVATACVAPSTPTVVLGCGPIGVAVIAALHAAGHDVVAGVDPVERRRAAAATAGASHICTPADVGASGPLPIAEAPPPSPLRDGHGPPRPPLVVFECVGSAGVIDAVMEWMPQHGLLVSAGGFAGEDRLRPALGVKREITIRFVFAYTRDELALAVERVAEFAANEQGMAADVVPFEDVAGDAAALAAMNDRTKLLVELPPRTGGGV